MTRTESSMNKASCICSAAASRVSVWPEPLTFRALADNFPETSTLPPEPGDLMTSADLSSSPLAPPLMLTGLAPLSLPITRVDEDSEVSAAPPMASPPAAALALPPSVIAAVVLAVRNSRERPASAMALRSLAVSVPDITKDWITATPLSAIVRPPNCLIWSGPLRKI